MSEAIQAIKPSPSCTPRSLREAFRLAPEKAAAAYLAAAPEEIISIRARGWHCRLMEPLNAFPVACTVDCTLTGGRFVSLQVCYLLNLLPGQTKTAFPSVRPEQAPAADDCPCTETLLPLPTGETLDALADRVLAACLPHRIRADDPAELAAALGLKQIRLRLSPRVSALGLLCFQDCMAVAEDACGEYRCYRLASGTLVINTRRCSPQDEATTILHEAAHWLLEAPFRLLQWNRAALTIPLEEIEASVEALRCRLSLPAPWLRRKLLSSGLHSASSPEVLRRVMLSLAAETGMAVHDIRERLTALGLLSAAGVALPGDDFPTHSASLWTPGVSYAIPPEAVAQLMAEDQSFRQLACSGRFVYSDSFFCLNSPEWLLPGGRMTGRALSSVERCCLSFRVRPADRTECCPGTHASRLSLRLKCVYELAALPPGVWHEREEDRLNRVASADQQLVDSASSWHALLMCIRSALDFPSAAANVCRRLGAKNVDLAGAMMVSEAAISKLLHAVRPSRFQVTGLCVALALPYFISSLLLDLAGAALNYSEEDMLLRLFLSAPGRYTVEDCNRILLRAGAHPLTRGKE